MINLTYSAGAIRPERLAAVVGRLVDALIRHHIAARAPEQLARATLTRVVEMGPDRVFVGHRPVDLPHYDIEIVVPADSITGERYLAIAREMTEVLLAEEGTTWNTADAERVWILVRDVPDGRWSVGGAILDAMGILKRLILEKVRADRAARRAAEVV